MAGNAPELRVVGSINKKATIDKIQKNLNEISKSLTLTIGVDKSGKSELANQTKKTTKDVEKMYASMFDKIDGQRAELDLKFWKAQEKHAANTRKLTDTQIKESQKVSAEKEKQLQYEQKLRYTIAKNEQKETNIREKLENQNKHNSILDETIHLMKTKQITDKEALGILNMYVDGNEHLSLSLKDQVKLIKATEIANNSYTKSVIDKQKVEKAIYNETKNMYAGLFKIRDTEDADSAKKEKALKTELALIDKYTIKIKELQNSTIKTSEGLNKYRMSSSQKSEMQATLDSSNALNPALAKNSDELKVMAQRAEVASRGMRDLKSSVTSSGKSALKFSEYLKNAATAFSLWISVTTVFFATVRAINFGVDAVVELDKALLELRKVTDLTNDGIVEFLGNTEAISNRIGRTTTDVVKATSEFAKMGYSISESMRLAEDALILQNVGDNIDSVSQSTEILISVLKGFNLEASSSSRVISALNEVANNFAVGTDDLSEGIKRAAAVASVAGASFEQTLGMLTAMTEVSQNAEKSSTALKTLTMRLQGLSSEGESLGGNFTAKLNDTFESVAGVSITLEGKLRNVFDVVTDLGSKWEGLTREQQMYIAQEAVGIRQAGEFISLIRQYKTAISATETALNSQGSALKENEKYMDSIAGKTQMFITELKNLWTNLISSDAVKFIIEIGTELIKFIDNVGVLTVVLGVLAVSLFTTTTGAKLLSLGFDILNIAQGKSVMVTAANTSAMAALKTAMLAVPYVALAAGAILFVNAVASANKEVAEYNKKLEENKKRISDILYLGEQADIKDTIKAIEEAQKKIKVYTDTYGKIRFGWDAKKERESYNEGMDALAEYGLTASNAGERLKQLKDRIKELTSEESKSAQQTRLNSQILDDLRANVTDVVDIQETYSDLTQEIADGQKISGIELLNLIQKYPELSKHMDANNELLLTKDMLEKTVWETEKSIAVKRMQTIKEEMVARQNSLKTLLADYETVYSIGSQLSGQSAAIFMQKISAAKKELEETTKSILEADASIKIITGMKLSDYTPSKSKSDSSDKKDILSNFSAQEKAVSDLAYEMDILGKKIEIAEGAEKVALQEKSLSLYEKQQDAVHAYSDAIRALIAKGGLSAEDLETLNGKLQDNGREWWAIESAIKSTADTMKNDLIKATEELLEAQEKVTKSLEDDLKKVIDARNTALENQIDALDDAQKIEEQINEDLDNQIKRQEILAEIAQKQLDIIKAKAELENIQNQRTVRMINAEGTAFTLIADPKAIAEKNEEIIKLNEDLGGLNNNLREHDLSVARTMAERKVEIEKQALQDQIDANKLALETITDITGQELDKQGILWATFASGVDAELQGIIGKIMTAIGLQQSLTGQITGVTSVVPTPATALGGTTTIKKGMNFDSMYNSTPIPVSNNSNKNSTVNNTPINVGTVILPNVTNGKNFAVELKDQILTNK